MRQYWADIYENREDAESINKLETDFIVNECGHYVQEEGGARRPTGRMDYQILYIAAGRVYFWLDGKRETAESGTMVVYPPYEKQIYTYDHSVTSDVYWIHFFGSDTSSFLQDLDLPYVTLIPAILPESALALWEQIIGEMLYKRPHYQQMVKALAFQLFITLSRSRIHMEEKQKALRTSGRLYAKKDRQQELVEALIDEINKNYASELSVEQMARNNGMSTAWLNQRFKQYTGLSPQQYITKTRLSHARQMLSEPAYNIGEIAQMCGYSDPLYFSRLFHARFGCSPKEFRLRVQTQHP